MAKRSGQPLYQGIADDLKRRILRNELTAGDRLLSIGEMSRCYSVSAITAKRAVNELQNAGLVHSVKGKGTFVASRTAAMDRITGSATQVPVRQLVLLVGAPESLRSRGFIAEIAENVENAAAQRQLRPRVSIVPSTVPEAHVDLLLQPTPGDGFVMLGVGHPHRVLALLQDRGMPVVLVDGVGSCHAVATDNFDGMRQLIDHLRALGHRRLQLSAWNPRATNPTNENERIAAFCSLCTDRGLQGSVVVDQPTGKLIAGVKGPDAPTAILFTQDDPAIEFILMARKAGLDVPAKISVSGFDGWTGHHREFQGLTTLRVDRARLGQTTVELLLRPNTPEPPHCEWVRVVGRLDVGQTTATAAGAVVAQQA